MSSETNGTKSHSESDKAIPFQGKQPYGMPSDLVIPKVMNIDDTDERLWVTNLPGPSSFLAIQLTNLRSLNPLRHLPTSPLQHLARLLREYPARQALWPLESLSTHGSRQRIHNQRPLAFASSMTGGLKREDIRLSLLVRRIY